MKCKIAYIIEGKIEFNDGNTESKILNSCVVNMSIRDGVQVYMTGNIAETANLIRCIHTRLSKDPQKYLEGTDPESLDQVVIKKKSNTCFRDILCQIPGVSLKTAKILVDKYECFADFYENFKMCGELKFENGRRISKNVSSNICKYLYKDKVVD